MGRLKRFVELVVPKRVYQALLPLYHFAWTLLAALYYRFPARSLTVIAVTGTKGKSSVAEMIASILTEAGHTVALSSTIHFTIGGESRPNKYKMTLPGHGFIQRFLREAVTKGATFAVVEVTSEAALQYRHTFLYLNALVFTNLEKEHLERHGGMESYFQAKFRIATSLLHSSKRPRAVIANAESEHGKRFLALAVEKQIPFTFADAENFQTTDEGIAFDYDGVRVTLPHPGAFSARNALAALKAASFLGVETKTGAAALAKLSKISGRAERIEAGQDFLAIVDYAHTPDSLRALYEAFGKKRKICVLGNTGGGRDTWKRPEMGRIAEEACEVVILTDEDPYDEDPDAIVAAMVGGMNKAPLIEMDRRKAIAYALREAKSGDVVLITGKGTDPYIMRASGAKESWSDGEVVREELEKLKS
ncbi:MAG: UDP-N-acetylmuramyl-tripeptide synthetase [Patescibacteria group bacterium]